MINLRSFTVSKKSLKKIYIYRVYPNFVLFFVAKTENFGVGAIASYSVGFYIFIYLKK